MHRGRKRAAGLRLRRDRRNIYLSLRFARGCGFDLRPANGITRRAVLPCARVRARAPSNLGHYNRAADSHSREFAGPPPPRALLLVPARSESSRSRRRPPGRKKPRIAAGSRGNQINFSVNLPASCRRPSRLTTLFRSRIRAGTRTILASCARDRFAGAKHASVLIASSASRRHRIASVHRLRSLSSFCPPSSANVLD